MATSTRPLLLWREPRAQKRLRELLACAERLDRFRWPNKIPVRAQATQDRFRINARFERLLHTHRDFPFEHPRAPKKWQVRTILVSGDGFQKFFRIGEKIRFSGVVGKFAFLYCSAMRGRFSRTVPSLLAVLVALLSGLNVLLVRAAALPGRGRATALLSALTVALILLATVRVLAALFSCLRSFLRIVLEVIAGHLGSPWLFTQ